jgi:hypothetical protein
MIFIIKKSLTIFLMPCKLWKNSKYNFKSWRRAHQKNLLNLIYNLKFGSTCFQQLIYLHSKAKTYTEYKYSMSFNNVLYIFK